MTEPSLATVSPVFTVNGEPAPALARDCVRLEIEEGLEGLRTLRAQFLAVGAGATGPPQPMLHLDGSVDFGNALEVCLGPDTDQRIVFDGTVSAIEAVFADGEPPRVVVLAEDALMRLRMTRRMRTYRHATDGEIAEELAAEHGLTPDVTLDGPRYDAVQQLNQSDLAFLRERARLLAAELWCTGRTLHMSSRPRRSGTKVALVQGNHLVFVRLCADLAHQRSEVVVGGYDADARDVIDERAGPEVVDTEIAGGRTGPRVLEKALGASTTLRVREVPLTGAEADALGARGDAAPRPELRHGDRDDPRHPGHGRGQPAHAAARRAAVRGRGLLRHPGPAHLRSAARAAHAVRGRTPDGQRGGVMALPAPVDGAAPGYYGVYPAIVTDLVDTEKSIGRIEVRFPWLGVRR